MAKSSKREALTACTGIRFILARGLCCGETARRRECIPSENTRRMVSSFGGGKDSEDGLWNTIRGWRRGIAGADRAPDQVVCAAARVDARGIHRARTR